MAYFIFRIPLFIGDQLSPNDRYIQIEEDDLNGALKRFLDDDWKLQQFKSAALWRIKRVSDAPSFSPLAVYKLPTEATPWYVRQSDYPIPLNVTAKAFFENTLYEEKITAFETGNPQEQTLMSSETQMTELQKEMIDGVILTTVEEAVKLCQKIITDEVVAKIDSTPARMLAHQAVNSSLGGAVLLFGSGFLLPKVEKRLPEGNPRELAKAVSRMARVRGFANTSNFVAKTLIKPLTMFFIEKASQLPDDFKAPVLPEGATDFVSTSEQNEAVKAPSATE